MASHPSSRTPATASRVKTVSQAIVPAAKSRWARKPKQEVTFWKKLGGGSLTISILFHAIILIITVVWIFQIVPPVEPSIDFMPSSGGGGSPGEKITQQRKLAHNVNINMPRVVAMNAQSGFTLPEPNPSSELESLGDLTNAGLSGGLGGSGVGGGRGDGIGPGFGDGLGPGLNTKGGTMTSFGISDPKGSGLVGTFYDTKQTPKRKPTGITVQELHKLVCDFTARNWDEKMFSTKYYQATQKLYQNRIYMPRIPAEEAPAAFYCEKEVEGKSWVVIYRGNVVAPKTGKFRFVGGADDMMAVRFNGKTVFDYGYRLSTVQYHTNGKFQPLIDGTVDADIAAKLKRSTAIEYPIKFLTYDSSPEYNRQIGGFAVGPEFEVRGGNTYPIEILISEVPGGYFSAALMIQDSDIKYPTKQGSPILHLFRTDNTLPAKGGLNLPPFATNSPVWKLSGGATFLDI